MPTAFRLTRREPLGTSLATAVEAEEGQHIGLAQVEPLASDAYHVDRKLVGPNGRISNRWRKGEPNFAGLTNREKRRQLVSLLGRVVRGIFIGVSQGHDSSSIASSFGTGTSSFRPIRIDGISPRETAPYPRLRPIPKTSQASSTVQVARPFNEFRSGVVVSAIFLGSPCLIQDFVRTF